MRLRPAASRSADSRWCAVFDIRSWNRLLVLPSFALAEFDSAEPSIEAPAPKRGPAPMVFAAPERNDPKPIRNGPPFLGLSTCA